MRTFVRLRKKERNSPQFLAIEAGNRPLRAVFFVNRSKCDRAFHWKKQSRPRDRPPTSEESQGTDSVPRRQKISPDPEIGCCQNDATRQPDSEDENRAVLDGSSR